MEWPDPYYVANTLLLLVHFLLRAYFVILTPDGSQYSKAHSLSDFYSWEKQVLAIMLTTVAWKALRRRSWANFAQNVFFWGKVVTGLTATMVDLRLAVWYGLAAFAVFAVFPQPMLEMQQASDKVRLLTPASLKEEEQVLSEGSWLVYYYTEPHEPSVAMAPAFVELAEQYGGDQLRFGCMDVCLWPRFAANELKVSPTTWGTQLPAVVMYRGGKEVGRLPATSEVDTWNNWRNYYTKKDVTRRFQLDGGGLAVPAGAKGSRGGAAVKSRQRQ